MDKSKAIGLFFIAYGACSLLEDMFFLAREFFTSGKKMESGEEIPLLERRLFECPLEKADDLCEIGYKFQRAEIVYKKISEKKWLAEILIDDNDSFENGYELEMENYIYTKIGKKVWTIERYD